MGAVELKGNIVFSVLLNMQSVSCHAILLTNSESAFQLTSGRAEVFGTELAPDKPYTFFPGAKVAVYTWHGCTLKLTGNTEGTYVAKETPMVSPGLLQGCFMCSTPAGLLGASHLLHCFHKHYMCIHAC